jgi:hypothetical protein
VGFKLIGSAKEADLSISPITLDTLDAGESGSNLHTVHSALWTASAPDGGVVRFVLNQSLGARAKDVLAQCTERLMQCTKETAARHAKAHAEACLRFGTLIHCPSRLSRARSDCARAIR